MAGSAGQQIQGGYCWRITCDLLWATIYLRGSHNSYWMKNRGAFSYSLETWSLEKGKQSRCFRRASDLKCFYIVPVFSVGLNMGSWVVVFLKDLLHTTFVIQLMSVIDILAYSCPFCQSSREGSSLFHSLCQRESWIPQRKHNLVSLY